MQRSSRNGYTVNGGKSESVFGDIGSFRQEVEGDTRSVNQKHGLCSFPALGFVYF